MRIALSQLNFTVGDFETNTSKMLEHVRLAKANGASLVVFPELAVCGYPPRDFLEFRHFIEKCSESVRRIAEACDGITAVVGAPTVNPEIKGKNLYNSACVVKDGVILDTVHKALLPTYDIFDEYRYFEPNRDFHCIRIDGKRIALTVCEDLWNIDDDPMYVSCPMDVLSAEHPELIINIAASPFDYLHGKERMDVLHRNVTKYGTPLIYVNHVGAQTELIFDGRSVALDRTGTIVSSAPAFEEALCFVDFRDGDLTPAEKEVKPEDAGKIASIHDALTIGIRDYFSKMGFRKAILGLSGGIDSAVVTALAATALGPENVRVLMMPSRFSSAGSVDDSLQLINELGVEHEIIPIHDIYDQYLKSLAPAFRDLPFNVTEENLQARIRGVLLMAESNKFGAILLNTSNKSELAVGYGTLYGDMCGGLSVIGDVYKTEVYQLAEYINRERQIIPEAIIRKAPSAELRPDQKDSDSLPEYDILDRLLFQYVEKRKSPEELIAMEFDQAMVKRVLKLVNTNEYKRHQFAPILRVSPKAFGSGRRLPIVGKYLS
jgi:NAD+ synthase (glutamine-hydrolysing)